MQWSPPRCRDIDTICKIIFSTLRTSLPGTLFVCPLSVPPPIVRLQLAFLGCICVCDRSLPACGSSAIDAAQAPSFDSTRNRLPIEEYKIGVGAPRRSVYANMSISRLRCQNPLVLAHLLTSPEVCTPLEDDQERVSQHPRVQALILVSPGLNLRT